MKKLLATGLILFSSMTVASEATVRIGEESIGITLNPQDSKADAKNSSEITYIYNDEMSSKLISVGIFANGSRGKLDIQLGGKVYYTDLKYESGYGFAVGGDVSVPLHTDLRLSVGAYYGPDSLSFNDVEGYKEWFVKLNYRVFDNAYIGAGYGLLSIEQEDDRIVRDKDIDIEDGFFAEMSLRF